MLHILFMLLAATEFAALRSLDLALDVSDKAAMFNDAFETGAIRECGSSTVFSYDFDGDDDLSF